MAGAAADSASKRRKTAGQNPPIWTAAVAKAMVKKHGPGWLKAAQDRVVKNHWANALKKQRGRRQYRPRRKYMASVPRSVRTHMDAIPSLLVTSRQRIPITTTANNTHMLLYKWVNGNYRILRWDWTAAGGETTIGFEKNMDLAAPISIRPAGAHMSIRNVTEAQSLCGLVRIVPILEPLDVSTVAVGGYATFQPAMQEKMENLLSSHPQSVSCTGRELATTKIFKSKLMNAWSNEKIWNWNGTEDIAAVCNLMREQKGTPISGWVVQFLPSTTDQKYEVTFFHADRCTYQVGSVLHRVTASKSAGPAPIGPAPADPLLTGAAGANA